MNHNLFLSWLSESGEGTWTEFSRAHEWAFPSLPGQRRNSAYWTAGTYASLGHLEVDWDAGRWSVAPPTISILPGAGEYAVLMGSRTRYLMSRISEATDESVTQDLLLVTLPQLNAPDAVFIAATSEPDLQSLADTLDIAFEHAVGEALAALFPPLGSRLRPIAAPPVSSQELERWDPSDGLWKTAGSGFVAGLYRYRSSGLRRYRLFDIHGNCFDVDFPSGAYAELARAGRQVVRYEEEPVNGSLIVNGRTPLPALHARALALCSGIAPSYNSRAGTLRYFNVPRSLAREVCRSLRQPEIEAA